MYVCVCVCVCICMNVCVYIYICVLCCLQEAAVLDIGLAPEYSADYPVMFNIILWFAIVFTFSLLAISSKFNS